MTVRDNVKQEVAAFIDTKISELKNNRSNLEFEMQVLRKKYADIEEQIAEYLRMSDHLGV